MSGIKCRSRHHVLGHEGSVTSPAPLLCRGRLLGWRAARPVTWERMMPQPLRHNQTPPFISLPLSHRQGRIGNCSFRPVLPSWLQIGTAAVNSDPFMSFPCFPRNGNIKQVIAAGKFVRLDLVLSRLPVANYDRSYLRKVNIRLLYELHFNIRIIFFNRGQTASYQKCQ